MSIKQIIKKNHYLNRKYIEYKWRERRVSYGSDNPDKTFYVIRRTPCSVGLFSYVSTVLGHIKYALDRGYIPIVDMQNYENTYLEEGLLGKVNAWEYYFEQPMGYTLRDIEHSKNVILSWAEGTKEFPDYSMIINQEKYLMWYEYAQKYIRLSAEVEKEAQKRQEDLFKESTIVGVLCRGTDYINNRPPQHPIQPEIQDVIVEVEKKLKETGSRYVYLATEDESIYEKFNIHFGDKLLVTESRRYHDIGNRNINEIKTNRDNDSYTKGLEYLISIVLLSRCNYLVAGCSGGTYGAMLLTHGFCDQSVFYLGCY